MKFVILLKKTGTSEAFQAAVPGHIAYLEELHQRGALIAGGPFRDGEGGMLLIEAEDESAADTIAQADPFIAQGVESYTLRSWEILSPVKADLLTRDG